MDTILVKEGSQIIPWIVRSKIVLVFLLDVSRQFQMNLRCLTKRGKILTLSLKRIRSYQYNTVHGRHKVINGFTQ